MPLSPHLRERILRQLDTLNDEKGYQVLDFVEFVTSRYGARDVSTGNIFTRFTEGVEDTLRAGKVSATAISEAMGLMNKAAGVLSGVAAAGKSVASDIVSGVTSAVTPSTGETPTPSPPATPSSPEPPKDPPTA